MTKSGYLITFVWVGTLLVGSYFGLIAGHDAWKSLALGIANQQSEGIPIAEERLTANVLPQADKDRLLGGLDSLAETLKSYQEQLLRR